MVHVSGAVTRRIAPWRGTASDGHLPVIAPCFTFAAPSKTLCFWCLLAVGDQVVGPQTHGVDADEALKEEGRRGEARTGRWGREGV